MLTTPQSGTGCGSDSLIVPNDPRALATRYRMLRAASSSRAGMPTDSGAHLGIDNQPLQIQLLKEAWRIWTRQGLVRSSLADTRISVRAEIESSLRDALNSGRITGQVAATASNGIAIDVLVRHWRAHAELELEQHAEGPDQLLFATGPRFLQDISRSWQLGGTYGVLTEAFPHLLDEDGQFLVLVPSVVAEYVATHAIDVQDIGQWAGAHDGGDDATVLRLALKLWDHEREGDLRSSSEALATARSIVAGTRTYAFAG